jgi:uncharacterized RDD family membrane protein YckC
MLTAGGSNLKPDEDKPGLGTARWKPPTSREHIRVLDTTMDVTTPENIAFHYQIAGPFRRIFAYVVDVAISLGGYFAFVLLIYLLFIFAIFPLATRFGGFAIVGAIAGILAGLIQIGYFFVYWFYGAYMETYFNGQTLGKRFTRMRVISTDGHGIDGTQAMLRNFVRLLDIMPMVPFSALFLMDEASPLGLPTCLFGLVVMSLSRRYQRVGDLVANTVVVNEESRQLPELATFMDARVPKLAELIPTSYVVPASMARAIADYVDRRKYLPFQRASEIAGYVAGPLLEKFSLAPDTDHDLFLCALYYKTFITSQTNGDDEVPMPVAQQPQPVPVVSQSSYVANESVVESPLVPDVE